MMIQRNLIAALFCGGLLSLPAFAQNAEVQAFAAAGGTPQVLWSLPIGEEDSDDDEVDGIAVDDGGNVAISGSRAHRRGNGSTDGGSCSAADDLRYVQGRGSRHVP